MTETSRAIEELYRRALDLNLKYYASMGKLTVDYLRDLSSAVSSVRRETPDRATAPPSGSSRAQSEATASASARAGVPAVMVFEGEAGSTAVGVFLIGNSLTHEVSAPVAASPVLDDAGNGVSLSISFDPAVINLRPGEQVLVRAMAVIDKSLEPGVRYRGELLIPELQGTRIPFIVRRRSPDSGVAG